MTHSIGKTLLVGAAFLALTAAGAAARDQIRIVGSSTVFPFSTAVAEQFGKTSKFKTPVVESTGSGGGIKLFCAGVGTEHPDITNSSRRIKSSEVESCAKNGVKEITEVKIGFDGIVLANTKSQPTYQLTREEIFLALAKQVPSDGKMVNNPYTRWKQINDKLPNVEIEVLGPPPTSGTRDAFVELVMEHACESFDVIKKLEKNAKKAACATMREDGKFIEAGENDNLIVQKLEANPSALGIFGFSFLDQNTDKLHGSVVEGNAPTFDAIADGKYPVSRSMYFYVKKAHVGVIPGHKEYVTEFTSENAWGPDGYLAEKGLIPLPEQMRNEVAKSSQSLANLSM